MILAKLTIMCDAVQTQHFKRRSGAEASNQILLAHDSSAGGLQNQIITVVLKEDDANRVVAAGTKNGGLRGHLLEFQVGGVFSAPGVLKFEGRVVDVVPAPVAGAVKK